MADWIEEARQVQAADGYSLHCRVWKPKAGSIRGRILILHGIQSHSGWYTSLGQILAARGIETVMTDRRGSGLNQFERGHANSPGQLLDDLDAVHRAWRKWSGSARFEPLLGGISWGGKLAVAAAATRPAQWAGLALIAPGLFAKVRPPALTQLRIAVSTLVRPHRRFPIPLADPALFTANPERQHFIATDEPTLHEATARFFVTSRILDLRLRRYKSKISCPVLLQLAGSDRIIDNAKTRAYVEGLSSSSRRIVEYPDAHHTLEFESGEVSRRYATDLADWIAAAETTSGG